MIIEIKVKGADRKLLFYSETNPSVGEFAIDFDRELVFEDGISVLSGLKLTTYVTQLAHPLEPSL